MLTPNTPREIAATAIEAETRGLKVDMVASAGALTAVIALGGQAVEGLYGATQYLNSAQVMTPAFKAFGERDKARIG